MDPVPEDPEPTSPRMASGRLTGQRGSRSSPMGPESQSCFRRGLEEVAVSLWGQPLLGSQAPRDPDVFRSQGGSRHSVEIGSQSEAMPLSCTHWELSVVFVSLWALWGHSPQSSKHTTKLSPGLSLRLSKFVSRCGRGLSQWLGLIVDVRACRPHSLLSRDFANVFWSANHAVGQE